MKKAIGDALLTPFELYTCVLEAANLVNQRPIGRVPTDPDDGGYLCPNDILLGRATNAVPQGPFRETRNPLHRLTFEFCQIIIDAFWKKWSRDVLPLLTPRKKWNTQNRNVKVNDYVIVSEPNAMRGKWNTGKIVEVFHAWRRRFGQKCEGENCYGNLQPTYQQGMRNLSSRRLRWGVNGSSPIVGGSVSLTMKERYVRLL
jgi:hypothetical protein